MLILRDAVFIDAPHFYSILTTKVHPDKPDGPTDKSSEETNTLSLLQPISFRGLFSSPFRPGVVTYGIPPLVIPNRICVQSCKLCGLFVSVSLLKELKAFPALNRRNSLLPEGLDVFFHGLPPLEQPLLKRSSCR